jgi:hypothetical protein
MSYRGRAYYRGNDGRGAVEQRFPRGNWRGSSTSSGGLEVPSGNLVAVLNAAFMMPSTGPIQMSNFRSVASYNWLNRKEPIILVPGMSIVYP